MCARDRVCAKERCMQGRVCAKDRRVCKGEVCTKGKVWERVVQGRGVSSRLSTFDNSDLLLVTFFNVGTVSITLSMGP